MTATENANNAAVKWACRMARFLGGFVFIAGLTAFLGWALNVQRLADWNGDGITIQPNNTVLMMLAGIAVMLIAWGRQRAGAIIGVVAGAIGFATFSQYLHGVDLGIDQLLLFGRDWGAKGTVVHGRMGPPASFSWTLLLCGFLLLLGSGRERRFVPAFAFTVLLIAMVSFVGYMMGADSLYALPRLTVIAWQTSVMFIAVAVGLLAALNDLRPISFVVEDSVTGMLLRRLILPLVVIPLSLGAFRVAGQQAGFYDTAMGTALLIIVLIGVFLLVMFIIAANASQFEAGKLEAEKAVQAAAAELAELNIDLEDRVKARTEALSDANIALSEEMHGRIAAEKERIAVLGRMLTAQEDERRRIAAELHDQLGQHMTAIRLRLNALNAEAGKADGDRLSESIRKIIDIAVELDMDLDGITASLRPRSLDTLGLSDALAQYVAKWQQQSGILAEFHANGYREGTLGPDGETALFRITQEALNNCAKHSVAGLVNVLLGCRDTSVTLVIEDDGKGFDPEKMLIGDGLGLTSMRERCEMAGGEFAVESERDNGTTILITIPVTKNKQAAKTEA